MLHYGVSVTNQTENVVGYNRCGILRDAMLPDKLIWVDMGCTGPEIPFDPMLKSTCYRKCEH